MAAQIQRTGIAKAMRRIGVTTSTSVVWHSASRSIRRVGPRPVETQRRQRRRHQTMTTIAHTDRQVWRAQRLREMVAAVPFTSAHQGPHADGDYREADD